MFLRLFRAKFMAVFLGTTGTGFLAQLTIFFETLRMCGSMGTRRAVVRQIAQSREEGRAGPVYRRIVSTSFFLVLASSLVLGAAVALFSRRIALAIYGDPGYYLYVAAMGGILPFASTSTLVSSILKANLAFTSFAKYTLAAYFAVIVATPALIYFWGYAGAVFIQFLFFALPLGAYLVLNVREPFLFFSRGIDAAALREQFSDGFNFLYQETLSLFARLVIATWITKGLGLGEMGIYQVVLTFTTVYMTIPTQAIGGYTMPVIARATETAEITKAVNDSLRLLLFVLVPVLAVLMAWPEPLIALLYSGEFLPAGPVLRLQLWGVLCSIACYALGSCFVAKGRLKILYFTSTLHAAVLFGLTALWFERWGLYAAAAAFVAAHAGVLAVLLVMARRAFRVGIMPMNRKLLGATVAWLALAAAAGAWLAHPAGRVLALALGVPWFFLSSKDHERRFLADRVRALFARTR
jgi:O-antigen/teichoic acid export membrane protein